MEYFYCHFSYGEDILNSRSVVPHSFDIIYSDLRRRFCVEKYFYSERFISGAVPGFGQGGPQLLWSKVADIVKWSCVGRASHLRLGSRAFKLALEALMLKYAFSHVLETLFLSTLKTDKNSTSHCTSINLRYFYVLYPFFNLHEKVMPLIV